MYIQKEAHFLFVINSSQELRTGVGGLCVCGKVHYFNVIYYIVFESKMFFWLGSGSVSVSVHSCATIDSTKLKIWPKICRRRHLVSFTWTLHKLVEHHLVCTVQRNYVHLQCLIWIHRKCSVLSLFTYIVYAPLWIAYSVFTFKIMYICMLIKQCMYNICTFKMSHKIHQACSVCVTLDINYAPREMLIPCSWWKLHQKRVGS